MPFPDFDDFVRLAGTGDLVPVWREFLFDADTAVTAYAKLVRMPPSAPSAGAAPSANATAPGGATVAPSAAADALSVRRSATPAADSQASPLHARAATDESAAHETAADDASAEGGGAPPRFGFLLESVVGGEKWARYTFLGTAPREAWRLERGGRVSRWRPDTGWSAPEPTADPLGVLDRLLRSRTPVTVPGLPRFFGGAVGYLGYDVVRYIERQALGQTQPAPEGNPRGPDAPRASEREDDPAGSAPPAQARPTIPVEPLPSAGPVGAPPSAIPVEPLRPTAADAQQRHTAPDAPPTPSTPDEPLRPTIPDAPPDELGLPEALFLFTDVVLAIDNLFGRAYAITTVDVAGDPEMPELRRLYGEATTKLDAVVHTLATAPGAEPLALAAADADVAFESSYAREDFEVDVRRIKDYIAAGDALQVVLSQRLTIPLGADPFHLYRALRSLNPSPYLYFLELDGLAVVGSSPEALVRVEDGRVVVRPIAGTRVRGKSDEEDAALAAELRSDEKERAEHLMLVDLGRNDVGRVARFGTVQVPEFMAIETYSHVLHLVSQVEGELRDGLSAMDVLRACFPAGTVSGAPKIRAMQIIDELEPVRRGPYAGAVGYFAYGGEAMDTAIAIRTLIAACGRAHVQAGAGIVADSVPASEYEETLAKARALVHVLAMVPSDHVS